MKSMLGSPNVRFTRLALLKPHSPNANVKLAHLVKNKRHAPLGTGPSSPGALKHLCSDAIISNAKAASLISRDTRLAFRSHNARTASQNLATQRHEAKMPPALSIARPISLIPLPWI